jgi:hypothetical protein
MIYIMFIVLGLILSTLVEAKFGEKWTHCLINLHELIAKKLKLRKERNRGKE